MNKIFNHPLITHNLSIIRDKNISFYEFRDRVNKITSLMMYDVMSNLSLKTSVISTPICNTIQKKLKSDIVLIPILRAGLGMVDGVINVIPESKIGHIGMERDDETLTSKCYYYKIPNLNDDSLIFILDPMLATGGTVSDTINILKSYGVNNKITLVCLVGAPQGLEKINKRHPGVDVYLAALDEELTDKGYIKPGLGDAGDRIFGTY